MFQDDSPFSNGKIDLRQRETGRNDGGFRSRKRHKKVSEKIGLSPKDIRPIEIKEAFADQYLSCEIELRLNRHIVNVNGRGIALGHPVGAMGCHLVVTLLHEMAKRHLTLGLATLCGGGGLGFALVIERS